MARITLTREGRVLYNGRETGFWSKWHWHPVTYSAQFAGSTPGGNGWSVFLETKTQAELRARILAADKEAAAA